VKCLVTPTEQILNCDTDIFQRVLHLFASPSNRLWSLIRFIDWCIDSSHIWYYGRILIYFNFQAVTAATKNTSLTNQNVPNSQRSSSSPAPGKLLSTPSVKGHQPPRSQPSPTPTGLKNLIVPDLSQLKPVNYVSCILICSCQPRPCDTLFVCQCLVSKKLYLDVWSFFSHSNFVVSQWQKLFLSPSSWTHKNKITIFIPLKSQSFLRVNKNWP